MILFIHISCISVVYNYQIITENEFFYEKHSNNLYPFFYTYRES